MLPDIDFDVTHLRPIEWVSTAEINPKAISSNTMRDRNRGMRRNPSELSRRLKKSVLFFIQCISLKTVDADRIFPVST